MRLGLLIAIGAALSAAPALAGKTTHVDGYVKKDGTYVAPHYKTTPNDTKLDNYGTKGNWNPYTGKEGTVDPYKVTPSNPTGSQNNSHNYNPSATGSKK